MLKVKLLAHTGDPEQLIATAAKLCYSESGIDDIAEGLDEQTTSSFVHFLMGLGHESPIEHVSFTFGIEGVSRSLLAQLTRHRIASYSVKSQRYVREGQFEYITPPEIAANPPAKELYIHTMELLQQQYERLVSMLQDQYIANGMEKQPAQKKAIEDARFVLPNACETKIVMSMNARSLINFFHHRCCSRAQWEIRALADEMLLLVQEVCPSVFQNCGPRCVSGACPEGRMSCGKMNEMREKYAHRAGRR